MRKRRAMKVVAVGLILSGCSTKSETPAQADPQLQTTGSEAQDSGEPAFSHRFSMAIVADPHVTGPGEHEDRLNAAVDWILANASSRDIQLVAVLGDICWGSGFDIAHTSLDRLNMPWVPIMGDNVVVAGESSIFYDTFDAQLNQLETQLTNFERQPAPVYNPEMDEDNWLQNIAFDHEGVRFLGADLNSREDHPLWSETPDLHDFEGGTWPWLTAQLDQLEGRPSDSVILLSHMPLFEGGGSLTADEADTVVEAFYPRRDALWANLAGHLHWSASDIWTRAGIEVHVTDATWDDENTIRMIDVSGNGMRFVYEHELVVID
jgi:hypothetical protein